MRKLKYVKVIGNRCSTKAFERFGWTIVQMIFSNNVTHIWYRKLGGK